MPSAPSHRPAPFPRAPLFAAAGLIVATLLAAGLGRLTPPAPAPDPGLPVATRDLRFEDTPDGSIAIYAGTDPAPIERVAVGQDGFLRSTLRGLARERRRQSLGPAAPFRLAAWPGGRLTLEDTATGRRVELEAFGPTNAQAFGRLLTAGAVR